MVTKQLKGSPKDEADLTRADSLAREVFTDIADKWALLIIEAVGERTLPMLERNGLVERRVHPVVPPRVEYTLTEAGRALRATVAAMCDWTHRYLGHIETARHRFDA